MKKLLALLFLLPSLVFAQVVPGSPTIWEKAAFGEIPGVTHLIISGWNSGVNTTYEVAWGESAAYTPLVAAMSTPYCASSDANDTSAGTGARTISVTGVNTSFARFTETVTMNGTSSVNLATTNVLFIDKITVLTAGSGLLNAGIIQCGTGANTGGDPAVTHQYLGISSATAIPAAGAGGGNVSNSFMYGVPASYTAICKDLTLTDYLATTVIGIGAVVDGYTNSTGVFKRYAYLGGNNAGGQPSKYDGFLVFPEKTLILGKVVSTSATVSFLSMQCLLISNTWEDTSQILF